MWVLAILACGRAPDAPVQGPVDASSADVEITFVLDPGALSEGVWTSDASAPADTLRVRGAVRGQDARRWRARVPIGEGSARVERPCGAVDVPFVATPAVPVVSLPYPSCDAPIDAPNGLDRSERPWSDVSAMAALGLPFAVPPAPAGREFGPAAFVTLAEARGACAWLGGRLPTRADWEVSREGADPALANGGRLRERTRGPLDATSRAAMGLAPHASLGGHLDLDGNVEEWLEDGTVAGGSFASLPDELGQVRDMPADARSETIGFRCAFGVVHDAR